VILEALGLEEVAIEIAGKKLLVPGCRRLKAVLILLVFFSGIAGLRDGFDADHIGSIVDGTSQQPSEEDAEDFRVILL